MHNSPSMIAKVGHRMDMGWSAWSHHQCARMHNSPTMIENTTKNNQDTSFHMSHKRYYLTLKCGNHDASLWNLILPIWYMENPNMCAFSASDINLHLISILLFISSDFLWWHTVELHVWYIVQCLFPGLRQTAFVRFLHSGWQQCFQVDCCIQAPH